MQQLTIRVVASGRKVISATEHWGLPKLLFETMIILPWNAVLRNKVKHPDSKLKYIYYSVLDYQVGQFLDFLEFWERFGYGKFLKYASSVKIEMLAEQVGPTKWHFIRIWYDDEIVPLHFCKDPQMCELEEYLEHTEKNLLMLNLEGENFAGGAEGEVAYDTKVHHDEYCK